jgi:hypothetical protein
MRKLIFILAVTLLSQMVVAQKEAYFNHEPNGDGVYFSGTLKYYPNVKGGLEFRVIISDINIEAIRFNGKKYYTGDFNAPNKEDIKGTLYFSGNASHGSYSFQQTIFNNCGITIELSKNTTTANMLQDNGSAYFSEAITDNYFKNKTEFEASVKSDVHGGGANWVKYWKDHGHISNLKADRYINLHVSGTNNTTVFDYLKNQIVKKQQEEEFYNLRLQLSDKSREGRTQQEYEDALKIIESALIKYKDENYQTELVKFKNDVLAQIDKLKSKENATTTNNNISQNNKSVDSKDKKEESKKDNPKTIIRYSPEELARINAQIAYQNNVSNYQAKGLDYNSAHRMAQNDYKIEAMDKLGKDISKQLGNMVYNILDERDRRIEERENKHYSHIAYVKNYGEAISKNQKAFVKNLKSQLPIYEKHSSNAYDLKQELLYLIETLGNLQYSDYTGRAMIIAEQEITDVFFEGNILKISINRKCIVNSFEHINLIQSKKSAPITYKRWNTQIDYNFETAEEKIYHQIVWANGMALPNTTQMMKSADFYQSLKNINNETFVVPYYTYIRYMDSEPINEKKYKLIEIIKNENYEIEKSYLKDSESSLNNKNFIKALELTKKAEEKRGYVSLENRIIRLKIYHDSKDWYNANKEYETIDSIKPENHILNSLKLYHDNILEAKRNDGERWREAKKTNTKQAYEAYIKNGISDFYLDKAKKIVQYWDQRVIYVYPKYENTRRLGIHEQIGMNSSEKIYQYSEKEFNKECVYFYNIKELYHTGTLQSLPAELVQNEGLEVLSINIIFPNEETKGRQTGISTLIKIIPNVKKLVVEARNVKDISFLTSYKNLVYLEIKGEHEQLPEFISTLYKLETLKISGVKNLESLSNDLGSFSKLKELEIDYLATKNQTSIQGKIPTLNKLTILFNSFNNIPDISNQFQNLESLSLKGRSLWDIYSIDLSKYIQNNHKIRTLKIDLPGKNINLHQNTINAIGSLKTLQCLTINVPTDADITPLNNLKGLTHLAINCRKFKKIEPIYVFKNLVVLEILSASNKVVISKKITELGKLRCLAISSDYSKIIDYKLPKEIYQMPYLRSIFLTRDNRSKSLKKFIVQCEKENKNIIFWGSEDFWEESCVNKISIN